jgi:hypothetical protein
MKLMNLGFHLVALERQEAYERAMSRFRAEKPREQRLSPARAKTGWRSISRDEAIALVAKKSPRGAFKLQMMPHPKSARGR